ncbi:MAG: YchJ family protein [Desulfobacteraceae bacterium]|nr:YchJ family protein [Desulfobacteraceae bacterium]MBC2755509.1 YchJ family protein [Desulfobacteraceae bacterium]
MNSCPCGSGIAYAECCEPVIKGEISAETAEQLMRARYCAYAKVETDFLLKSLHPDHRNGHDDNQTREWAANSTWEGLEIVKTENGGKDDSSGTVEFIAYYTVKEEKNKHHELASFIKHDDVWYFTDGAAVPPKQFVRASPKVGRNDPCPCNSGKKYKKCCGR